jgi:hypothetical protein
MTTIGQLKNDTERDYREAFRWRLEQMDKDELRGYADEDGDLDVGDLASHIYDEMNDDGATHEVVLASCPGISEHMDDLGQVDDLWRGIAWCIYRELENHLHGIAIDVGMDVISEVFPSLSIGPEPCDCDTAGCECRPGCECRRCSECDACVDERFTDDEGRCEGCADQPEVVA